MERLGRVDDKSSPPVVTTVPNCSLRQRTSPYTRRRKETPVLFPIALGRMRRLSPTSVSGNAAAIFRRTLRRKT